MTQKQENVAAHIKSVDVIPLVSTPLMELRISMSDGMNFSLTLTKGTISWEDMSERLIDLGLCIRDHYYEKQEEAK